MMNRIEFQTDEAKIPDDDADSSIHVFLYGSRPKRIGSASIGGRLELAVRRLGVGVDPIAFDFLSIALGVIAADTFIDRSGNSGNGWSREMALRIPLARPASWQAVARELEEALGFLSGDRWKLSFTEGGKEPPSKEAILRHHRSHIGIGSADCVCLFSGGLDSLIGARQLADSGRTPLLVSHSYRGDQSYQRLLAPRLGKRLPKFAANANPVFSGPNKNDTSMRTRSLGFLAFAVVASSALAAKNASRDPVELFVPENGFIALNAPLTRRRIGSHSTRTTHPGFLGQMQSIFETMNLPVRLENPYRHKTKGEMLVDLAPGEDLKSTTVATVSCGKWKRKSQQCGHCVPCLIRRAAFAKAGIADTTPYQYADIGRAWDRPDIRDDIMAMLVAVGRDQRGTRQRAIASGPLPFDAVERQGWFGVQERGLKEVGAYLKSQGLGT